MDDSVTSHPLRSEMWRVVAASLPADVDVTVVAGLDALPGPDLFLNLVRDGVVYQLEVVMQAARPDLEPVHCDRLNPGLYEAAECTDRSDSEGRTSVAAVRDAGFITVLEGRSVSVAVAWTDHAGVEQAQSSVSGDWVGVALTREEASVIAEAVWSLGAKHSADELTTGLDLEAIADNWSGVQPAFEAELGLGPLQPIDPSNEPDVQLSDEGHQVGTLSAGYVAEGGIEVQVVIQQAARFYDELCHAQAGCFQPFPSHAGSTSLGDGGLGQVSSTVLAQRAVIWLRTNSTDSDVQQKVSEHGHRAVHAALITMAGDRWQMG